MGALQGGRQLRLIENMLHILTKIGFDLKGKRLFYVFFELMWMEEWIE